MPETLASRIQRRRQRRRLTQKQAAGLVGISERQYQRYEAGTNSPSVEMLDRIARALETTPGMLL